MTWLKGLNDRVNWLLTPELIRKGCNYRSREALILIYAAWNLSSFDEHKVIDRYEQKCFESHSESCSHENSSAAASTSRDEERQGSKRRQNSKWSPHVSQSDKARLAKLRQHDVWLLKPGIRWVDTWRKTKDRKWSKPKDEAFGEGKQRQKLSDDGGGWGGIWGVFRFRRTVTILCSALRLSRSVNGHFKGHTPRFGAQSVCTLAVAASTSADRLFSNPSQGRAPLSGTFRQMNAPETDSRRSLIGASHFLTFWCSRCLENQMTLNSKSEGDQRGSKRNWCWTVCT